MIRMIDLGWTAGFLEGEGSFWAQHHIPCVTASQVQREPLERLEMLYGGRIYRMRNFSKKSEQPIHRWQVSGAQGRGLMMTLYPLMSPRRQGQIVKALSAWLSFRPKAPRFPIRASKTHCPQGHEYTEDNTYTFPDGRRECRECRRIHSLHSMRKRREAARELLGPVTVRAEKTHCTHGHPWIPENLYVDPKGRRQCLLCKNAGRKVWYANWIAKHAPERQPRAPKNMKTHCPRGHEYTPENSRIDTLGYRACRACS